MPSPTAIAGLKRLAEHAAGQLAETRGDPRGSDLSGSWSTARIRLYASAVLAEQALRLVVDCLDAGDEDEVQVPDEQRRELLPTALVRELDGILLEVERDNAGDERAANARGWLGGVTS